MANLDPAILAQLRAIADSPSARAMGGGGSIDSGEWSYVPVFQGGSNGDESGQSLIGYNQYKKGDQLNTNAGTPYAMYNPDGTFNRNATTRGSSSGLDLLATGIIAAISMGTMLPAMGATGAAGAGGTAVAGPGMAGWGADLGMEGLANTVGTGGVGFTPAAGGIGSGLGSGLTDLGLGPITDAGIVGSPLTAGAGAAGAPLPMGPGGWSAAVGSSGLGGSAGGGGLWEAVKSGASSLLPGAAGAGGLASYLGPAASLAGGLLGANAAKDAAGAQVESTREANLLQKAMFDKQIELQEPFRQAGILGKDALLSGLGLAGDSSAAGYGDLTRNMTRADYDDDPGHQFRMDEGLKGLERSAAARGNLLSGRAAKDTMRFAQGLGTQDWNDSFNRFEINRKARLNPLQSLMGSGQSSANTMTQAAGNYGQQVGNNTIEAGNARAAGRVGSANAINSGIGSAWNMYQNNQLMNKFFPSGA